MRLEPLAAAVRHFRRLKNAGLVATVGHSLNAGLHGSLRCSAVENLEQLVLANLSGLSLGNRGLDPLGLGQQRVVLGLANLGLGHSGTLAFVGGLLVAFHRRLYRLLSCVLEHAQLSESGGEFVEQFFDFAGGHVRGSCVR